MPDDSTLRRLEDQLLGGPRSLTLSQLAVRAGVSERAVRAFWQALGSPVTDPDAVAFTEEDARVLGLLLSAALDSGMARGGLASLERSVGHHTERMATWQAEALVEHYAEHYGLDDTSARLVLLDRMPWVAPLLEEQMLHAWRRHMAALAARFANEFAVARDVPTDALPLARSVGFADMVSFTVRTASMLPGELARFVRDFEEGAASIVTSNGGRVIKTIGDAVLFATDDATSGALIALDLARTFGVASPTPVRVGFVWGRVLSRFGDVFGASVNVAARLTDEAAPGTVLTDTATAALLADDGFVLTTEPEREVAGLGTVQPHRVVRAPGRSDAPDAPAGEPA